MKKVMQLRSLLTMKKSIREQKETLERQVSERTAALHQSLEDLKATQTQLVQREKMASLGEITAGVAHEIKNPLNFVKNFSEINTDLLEELKQEAQSKLDAVIAEKNQNSKVAKQ